LDILQDELESTYPLLNIQIAGINEFGQDPPGANELATEGRTIPLLQDVDGNANQVSDVWYDRWDVTYRDVVILNGQNEKIDVYNLTPPTGYDLRVAENYATLRNKLVDAAMTEQKPWQNHRDRFDINDDGFVVPRDVLIMINDIEDNGPRKLLPPTTTSLAAPYWDSNGDNFFSPIDILQVINFIEGVAAEGEASSEPARASATVAFVQPTSTPHTSGEVALPNTQPNDVSLEVPTELIYSTVVAQADTDAEVRARALKAAVDDFWAEDWWSL
jgi:hypothetical protein